MFNAVSIVNISEVFYHLLDFIINEFLNLLDNGCVCFYDKGFKHYLNL